MRDLNTGNRAHRASLNKAAISGMGDERFVKPIVVARMARFWWQ